MSICIATLFTPSIQSAGNLAVVNRKEYASLYGYSTEIATKVLDPTVSPNWNKLLFIKSILPKYDWVLWIDSDAMIMNYTTRLETFIDSAFDIIISKDEFAINNGVFFIKNSPASMHFLEEAINLKEFYSHVWTDNASMIRCIDPFIPLHEKEKEIQTYNQFLEDRLKWHREKRFFAKTKIVEQRLFNSYSGLCARRVVWSPGDFVSHAAGWSYSQGPGCPTLKQILLDLRDKSNYQISHRDEFGMLFNMLGYRGNGAEVGVLRGDYSRVIRSKWKGKMFLIDCWECQPQEAYNDSSNYQQKEQEDNYRTVLEAFRDDSNVEVIKGFSTPTAAKFPDGFFDWVYIDANHGYDAVLEDIRSWWPKIRRGGMICGHDFVDGDFVSHGKFGVESAVRKFCGEAGLSIMQTKEPSIEGLSFPSWYFIKTV